MLSINWEEVTKYRMIPKNSWSHTSYFLFFTQSVPNSVNLLPDDQKHRSSKILNFHGFRARNVEIWIIVEVITFFQICCGIALCNGDTLVQASNMLCTIQNLEYDWWHKNISVPLEKIFSISQYLIRESYPPFL